MMETEGQDITTGYPTLREANQRTSPTLVRLSQLTEPNHIYGTDARKLGKRKTGWAQTTYPIRARLQELKTINLLLEKWNDALEDKLIELKNGEQAFMSNRPRLNPSGIHNTLNHSHPVREWNKVLLPGSKRN